MSERFILHYFTNAKDMVEFLNTLHTEATVAASGGGVDRHNYWVIIDYAGMPTWHIFKGLASFLRREKCNG